MSGVNNTTMIQKLQKWADDNPTDLIFVLCVGGGIVVILLSLFGICLCFISKKTIIYEKIVNIKSTEQKSDL